MSVKYALFYAGTRRCLKVVGGRIVSLKGRNRLKLHGEFQYATGIVFFPKM
jgi:hypothetical protein